MSQSNTNHLSPSANAARNLATAAFTVPQWDEITPRWLHKLPPHINVDGGVNRVKKKKGGEPLLPRTFVGYEEDAREYHLSTIQTLLRTHTRITDLYSNEIDQLRLTLEAVKEVPPAQRIKTRAGAPTPNISTATASPSAPGITARFPPCAISELKVLSVRPWRSIIQAKRRTSWFVSSNECPGPGDFHENHPTRRAAKAA